jgi:hypothetical protein
MGEVLLWKKRTMNTGKNDLARQTKLEAWTVMLEARG